MGIVYARPGLPVVEHSLGVVSSGTGAGDPLVVGDLIDKFIQVSGLAGGASIAIEGSGQAGAVWTATPMLAPDGSWVTAITVNGVYAIDPSWYQIRTNRGTEGTGTHVLTLFARDARAE